MNRLKIVDSNPYSEVTHYFFERKEKLTLIPDMVWRIQSGYVRVTTVNSMGSVVTVGIWGKDHLVGNFLFPSAVLALECLTTVRAYPIPNHQLAMFSNELMLQFQQNHHFCALIQNRSLPHRVLEFIDWLVEQFGVPVAKGYLLPLRLTHQEIADALGTTRVTITRLMKYWQTQGQLACQKNGIIRLSPELHEQNFPAQAVPQ